jgi:hypothetical protein
MMAIGWLENAGKLDTGPPGLGILGVSVCFFKPPHPTLVIDDKKNRFNPMIFPFASFCFVFALFFH